MASKMTLAKRRRRADVVAAHGMTCWLCHKEIAADKLSMDHVVPKSKGGFATRDNLRPAHKRCNELRKDGPPPELLLTRDMMVAADELESA